MRSAAHWPPKGIEVLDPWGFPLLNTMILLCSGTTVTWAHHSLIHGDRDGLKLGLWLTILLGLTFTSIQAYEYTHAPFAFKGNIYGSTFFMATGFHGFHVIVGTIFLIVCLIRAYKRRLHPTAAFRVRGGRLVLAFRRRRVAVPVHLDLRLGRLGRAVTRVIDPGAVVAARSAAAALARAAARAPCSPAGSTVRAAMPRRAGSTSPAFNVGDGPAAFLILIVGAIVVGRRDRRRRLPSEPPWWVHLVWIPVAAVLTIGGLRCPRRGCSARNIATGRARDGSANDPALARSSRRSSSLAAVATMIGLGVWQLQRAQWKERCSRDMRRPRRCRRSALPTVPLRDDQLPLFRHATGLCLRVVGQRAPAGENRAGEPGFAHIVDCATGAEGPGMSVEVGWSKNPNAKVGLARAAWSAESSRRTAGRGCGWSRRARRRGSKPSAPPSLDSPSPTIIGAMRFQWFAFARDRAASSMCWRCASGWSARGRPEMMQLTTLANGLRVASRPMHERRDGRGRSLCRDGSRNEPARLNGVAHLFEHMVFKGAGGRSAREISELVEDVGGDLNACDRPRPDGFLPEPAGARARRSASSCSPTWSSARISTRPTSSSRRRSCCRSWRKRSDTPSDIVFDNAAGSRFRDQPLGRSVLGDERTIARDDRGRPARLAGDAISCRARWCWSAAGKLDHERLVDLAEARSATCAARPGRSRRRQLHRRQPLRTPQERAGAYRASPWRRRSGGATDAYALANVRRRRRRRAHRRACSSSCARSRGWLIRCYAGARNYADTGLFWVYVASDAPTPAWSHREIERVVAEAAADLSQRELERAQRTRQGGHDDEPRKLLGPGELSSRRGCSRDGALVEPAEIVARLDAVTLDEVRAVGTRDARRAARDRERRRQARAAPRERPHDDRRRAVGRLGPDRLRQRPEARALRPLHGRPARAAGDVGAGARRLGPRRDLRPGLGRGRRRALGPASAGAAPVGVVARRGQVPRHR